MDDREAVFARSKTARELELERESEEGDAARLARRRHITDSSRLLLQHTNKESLAAVPLRKCPRPKRGRQEIIRLKPQFHQTFPRDIREFWM